MLFAVRAVEAHYNGLHGIESCFVCDADTREIVEEVAIEASRDLMSSYDFLMEEMREAAAEIDGSSEYDEDKHADTLEEMIEENIEYEIHTLDKDLTLKPEELEDILDEIGYQEFVAEYCVD